MTPLDVRVCRSGRPGDVRTTIISPSIFVLVAGVVVDLFHQHGRGNPSHLLTGLTDRGDGDHVVRGEVVVVVPDDQQVVGDILKTIQRRGSMPADRSTAAYAQPASNVARAAGSVASAGTRCAVRRRSGSA